MMPSYGSAHLPEYLVRLDDSDDQSTDVIALKICDKAEENTYIAKKAKNSESGFINCTGFFKYHGIDTTVKRETEWLGTSDNDTVIYFKIK